jgi:hypothetical protein
MTLGEERSLLLFGGFKFVAALSMDFPPPLVRLLDLFFG